MKPLESHTDFVSITEIKWIGRFCIKCIARVDRQTGEREVTFKKWVLARYVVAQKQLMPGYWTDLHFAEFELRKKIAQAFAHMLEGKEANEAL